MKRHFKPNLVYVLNIDNDKVYVGCHNSNKKYLTENDILSNSGNPLAEKYTTYKEITKEEYLSRTYVNRIEECNSKEEALDLEEKLIKEYKEMFGDKCLNRSNSNRQNNKGLHIENKRRKATYELIGKLYRKSKKERTFNGNWTEFRREWRNYA